MDFPLQGGLQPRNALGEAPGRNRTQRKAWNVATCNGLLTVEAVREGDTTRQGGFEFKPAPPLGGDVAGVYYSDIRPGKGGKYPGVPLPGDRPDIPCTAQRTSMPPQLTDRAPPEVWEATYDAMQQRLWGALDLKHQCTTFECFCCWVFPVVGCCFNCFFGARRKLAWEAEELKKWTVFQQDEKTK